MNHELFQSEHDWIDDDEPSIEYPRVAERPGDGGWMPEMSDKQAAYYWDPARYVLAHGERFTGKTTCSLDKLLRHCYLYTGALAMIVVKMKSGAKGGGIWEQLLSEDLDHRGEPWGNLRKWKKGMGLQFTEEYGDDAKNKWVDIKTKNGGSSSIMLLSLNVAAHIKSKVRDFKPSYFHFEELQEAETSDYFDFPIQQLRRRASVPVEAQQYSATMNPPDKGEASWQFKTFFVHAPRDPRVGKNKSYDPKGYNPYTKKREGWNRNFGVHHLPSQDNVWAEDVAGYQESILERCKNDPTEYDRQILGLWVAKISGNSVFAHNYHPEIHLKGKLGVSGLAPLAGWPIIVGHDPGDVNNAKAFLQRVRSKGRWIWRAFDCLTDLQEMISYEDLVRYLFDRMLHWNRRIGHPFDYEHIGDQAAMNQFNAASGSFDYMLFEQISRMLINEEGGKYAELPPLTLKAPDKGAGSVGDRVRAVKNCLNSERLIVSALAPQLDEMFRNLMKSKDRHGNEDDDKPLKTKLGHIHLFDALSYPIFFHESSLAQDFQQDPGDLRCGTFH